MHTHTDTHTHWMKKEGGGHSIIWKRIKYELNEHRNLHMFYLFTLSDGSRMSTWFPFPMP